MIRQANKYDKTQIIEMMKEFRAEANFPELLEIENEQHWSALLDTLTP